MKGIKIIVYSLLGFVVGIFFTGAVLNVSAPTLLIKETVSQYNFDKTVSVLTDRINKAENWHVTAVIDQNAEIVKTGGPAIGKLKIIQYCSGKYSGAMLSADNRKKISVMMPKSFAVYEKDNGKVYIALTNGAFMGKLFKGEIYRIIEQVSLEVEGILSFINFKFSLI